MIKSGKIINKCTNDTQCISCPAALRQFFFTQTLLSTILFGWSPPLKEQLTMPQCLVMNIEIFRVIIAAKPLDITCTSSLDMCKQRQVQRVKLPKDITQKIGLNRKVLSYVPLGLKAI